jgi:hypothetical protein
MSPKRGSKMVRKKKIVAVVLLVLCAAMLAFLYTYQNSSEKKPTLVTTVPGDGSEAPVGAVSRPAPIVQGKDLGTGMAEPASISPAKQKQAEDSKPIIDTLTWSKLPENRILYEGYRIYFVDMKGLQVANWKIGNPNQMKLDLSIVQGLKENQLYRYKIVPISSDGREKTEAMRREGLKPEEGHFYLNAKSERPKPFRVLFPERDWQVVKTAKPKVRWQKAVDPDPKDKVHYIVEIHEKIYKRKGNRVGAWKAYGSFLTIPKQLIENKAYVVTVTAIDKDKKKTHAKQVIFRINEKDDPPTTPTTLAVKKDKTHRGYLLTWKKSKETDPSGKEVNDYVVKVRDEKSNSLVLQEMPKVPKFFFNSGKYGYTYQFSVQAFSSAKMPSGFSKWSRPFVYDFNYAYKPKIIEPNKDNEKLSLENSIVWTPGPDILFFNVNLGSTIIKAEKPQISVKELWSQLKLEFGQSYAIKVSARNKHGEETTFSEKRVVYLLNTPPSPPQKVSTSNGDGTKRKTKKEDLIKWSASNDLENDKPITYRVKILDQSKAEKITIDTESTYLSFGYIWKRVKELEKGFYYIQVMAVDARENISKPSKVLKYYLHVPWYS